MTPSFSFFSLSSAVVLQEETQLIMKRKPDDRGYVCVCVCARVLHGVCLPDENGLHRQPLNDREDQKEARIPFNTLNYSGCRAPLALQRLLFLRHPSLSLSAAWG